MARKAIHNKVNAVLIAGDGWHCAKAGSYENDGQAFSFITDAGPAVGSVVVGRALEVQAVRMVKSA